MASKRTPARDGLEILHRRFDEGRPERLVELAQARARAANSRRIDNLREASGFSYRKPARLAGIRATPVRRFEEHDFDGESTESFRMITHALGQRIEIRVLPDRRMRRPA